MSWHENFAREPTRGRTSANGFTHERVGESGVWHANEKTELSELKPRGECTGLVGRAAYREAIGKEGNWRGYAEVIVIYFEYNLEMVQLTP